VTHALTFSHEQFRSQRQTKHTDQSTLT